MSFLRPALWTLVVVMAAPAGAKAPPCARWGGVQESQALHFLEPSLVESSQSALIDFKSPRASSWMEARVSDSLLIFENRMPGLGLAMTVYHVRAEWVSALGETLSTQSFPEEGHCAGLSLFPGQVSLPFVLKRPLHDEVLRLRLRVWASQPY